MSGTLAVRCNTETVIVEPLDWDSRMLSRRCARVIAIQGTSSSPDFRPLAKFFTENGFEYVTARRPQSEWSRLHALEACGFRLLDGILTFSRDLSTHKTSAVPADLRLATAADADKVGLLAGQSFTFSRFHNDPILTPEMARTVHVEWARNSCLGDAADAVWLAEVGGELAGFSTCRVAGGTGTIVLVCVGAQFAGRGIGQKLTAQACDWFSKQKVQQVLVQTQTNNLAATALYFRSGFQLQSSSFTLRWAPKS